MKNFKAILATILAVMGFEAAAAAVDPGMTRLDKANDLQDRDVPNREGGFG